MALKIGCDPEFFLWDTKRRMFASCHTMIPGNKAKPHDLDGGAVQVDGTAVEFNTVPVETAADFVDTIECVLSQVRKMVPERYTFVFVPVVQYQSNYFSRLPRRVKELGCDPDFNAYTETPNRIVDPGNKRTGSGHIHIGWSTGLSTAFYDPRFKDCCKMVKCLDKELIDRGLMDLHLFDKFRRQYYGGLGAFRPKSYGLEYRVPSNAWIQSKELRRRMFELGQVIDG